MRTLFLIPPVGFFAGLFITPGCWGTSSHCANNGGDAACGQGYYCNACEIPSEPSMFDPGNSGCSVEMPAAECYFPGEESGISETASTGSTTEGEDPTTSTTLNDLNEADTSTTSNETTEACVSDLECDAVTPQCIEGECSPCAPDRGGNEACAVLDAGLPICADGSCVECTPDAEDACDGTTPLCDGATDTCVGCSDHDQCGDAACNLFTGACLPTVDGAVVHVRGPKPDFMTLTAAVDSFDPMAEGTIIVHHEGVSYDEAIVVDEGRVLAFLAAEVGGGSIPPRWVLPGGGGSQLVVAGPGWTAAGSSPTPGEASWCRARES